MPQTHGVGSDYWLPGSLRLHSIWSLSLALGGVELPGTPLFRLVRGEFLLQT